MSVTYTVNAIKPADEKFHRMKRVYDDCEELEIYPPEEVMEFFGSEEPDPKGVRIWLRDIKPERVGYETQWNVKLSDLPKDTAVIQFCVS